MDRRRLCLLPVLLGAAYYGLFGHPLLPIAQFEFARDGATAAELVVGRTDEFRDSIWADWVAFIPGYTLTIALCCLRLANRRVAWLGVCLAAIVAQCDFFENLNLYHGLDNGSDNAYAAGATFSTMKFALFVPALALAIYGLVKPEGWTSHLTWRRSPR